MGDRSKWVYKEGFAPCHEEHNLQSLALSVSATSLVHLNRIPVVSH